MCHNKAVLYRLIDWIIYDVRPVITNNPRALGQGLVGVWRLYHFPVVPTQGVIPEEDEY